MAAFLISDVSVRDADAFQIYRTRAAASIAEYGGNYLVRGGAITSLEGQWAPRTIIIVEFPNMEQARAWYSSPEYASALEVRDKALSRRGRPNIRDASRKVARGNSPRPVATSRVQRIEEAEFVSAGSRPAHTRVSKCP